MTFLRAWCAFVLVLHGSVEYGEALSPKDGVVQSMVGMRGMPVVSVDPKVESSGKVVKGGPSGKSRSQLPTRKGARRTRSKRPTAMLDAGMQQPKPASESTKCQLVEIKQLPDGTGPCSGIFQRIGSDDKYRKVNKASVEMDSFWHRNEQMRWQCSNSNRDLLAYFGPSLKVPFSAKRHEGRHEIGWFRKHKRFAQAEVQVKCSKRDPADFTAVTTVATPTPAITIAASKLPSAAPEKVAKAALEKRVAEAAKEQQRNQRKRVRVRISNGRAHAPKVEPGEKLGRASQRHADSAFQVFGSVGIRGRSRRKGKVRARYTPNGKFGMLQSTWPLKPIHEDSSLIYYEIKLISRGKRGAKAGKSKPASSRGAKDTSTKSKKTSQLSAMMGFSLAGSKSEPGFDGHSYSFSSEGKVFYQEGQFKAYFGTPWQSGDVIGAGINMESGELFFTWNGYFLGDALTNVPIRAFYASVSLSENPASVEVNFGPDFAFNYRDYEFANRIFSSYDFDGDGCLENRDFLQSTLEHFSPQDSCQLDPSLQANGGAAAAGLSMLFGK